MMKKSSRTSRFDLVGMLSSGLCLVHCLVFPFFVGVSHHAGWHFFNLDFLFLIIGLWAVWHASSHARTKGIRYMLWGSFAVLAGAVIWEELFTQINWLVYPAALALIVGHYLNLGKRKPKTTVSTRPRPMVVAQKG